MNNSLIIILVSLILVTIITIIFYRRNAKLHHYYQQQIMQLQLDFQQQITQLKMQQHQEIQQAQKRSVNTSRSVIKGKMAEQFAPILPEFEYLPSDAKFLGDPIDYIIFDGYSEFREGLKSADEISIILLDVKSGQAKLHQGQQAIVNAIAHGRVRCERLHIQFDDD